MAVQNQNSISPFFSQNLFKHVEEGAEKALGTVITALFQEERILLFAPKVWSPKPQQILLM
jgi:hypothetical protein